MSKDLKNFINDNRREFDDAVPGEDTWNRIESAVLGKKKAKVFTMRELVKWSAAAAVLCIILTSVYFLVIKKNSHETFAVSPGAPLQNQNTEGSYDISSIAPEYADEAKQAWQVIQSRQQELRSAASTQPDLYKQFSQDLATLDSSYRVLKNQAVKAPGREPIIRAMMQNLQLQAELLNRQLMIMNEFKNSKNKKDEKTI